jgi:GT2 family glycosyltransferase
MVEYMQANVDVAIVQPKIRLHSNYKNSGHRINTAGNESHFLGFGFVTAFNELDDGRYDKVRSIDFASGAAQMTRIDLIRNYGLFDESMFMYLEDTELSWKMRQLGYKVMYVPESLVYHKYDPTKTLNFIYHFEKNRFWLLFSYYKIPTLILIAPAALFMEIGLLGYSILNGCLKEKIRSYWFFLRRNNFKGLLQNRKTVKARRKVTDRIFVENHVGVITFFITMVINHN